MLRGITPRGTSCNSKTDINLKFIKVQISHVTSPHSDPSLFHFVENSPPSENHPPSHPSFVPIVKNP